MRVVWGNDQQGPRRKRRVRRAETVEGEYTVQTQPVGPGQSKVAPLSREAELVSDQLRSAQQRFSENAEEDEAQVERMPGMRRHVAKALRSYREVANMDKLAEFEKFGVDVVIG